MSNADIPAKPFGNSYWVIPGQLLAGEYPGVSSASETAKRVRRLLDAGIDTFIDLTQEGELPAYADTFSSGRQTARIRHLRFPITDHGVPSSATLMANILDAIDTNLAQGRKIYVHCRAGIGRTGTVIGCHLVRRGHSSDGVFDALNDLWRRCERSHKWPSIPETAAQLNYVRRWRDQARPAQISAAPTKGERYEGALLGLALGDAYGTGGRGIWGGDTAMTWILAESLLQRNGNDPEDQMQRYLRWLRSGEYSAGAQSPNAPKEVQRAVAAWQWNRKPLAGSHDPTNLDPHPLARSTAVALRYAPDITMAMNVAAEAARPTLQSPIVVDACRAFAGLMVKILQGADKTALVAVSQGAAAQSLGASMLKPPVQRFLDGGWRTPAKKRTGDIVAVLSDCWRAFAESSSFRDGLTRAVQASPLPSTAGAVYGALAGAFYGVKELPVELRTHLAQAAALATLAAGLCKQAAAHSSTRS